MKTQPVSIVRIYVREGEHLLDKVVTFLQEEVEVAGVTVLRGIAGFSDGGNLHSAFLTDLSLDLPLVIEFFDDPDRAKAVLHSLVRRFPLRHIVSWSADRHFVKDD